MYNENYNKKYSYNGGRPNYRNQTQDGENSAREPLNITPVNYVETADKIMRGLKGEKPELTTSKIRNILSMVSDLYNDVKKEHSKELSEEFQSRVQYLRLCLTYEAGREKAVKKFVERADLMHQLDSIGDSRDRLILLCHLMQVEEILLMPINVIGYSGMTGVKIKKAGKGIETTQSYYPNKNYPISLDPDMSDFAIGFYEILYNDFLSNPILNGEEKLSNNGFAGDTMNSFNTIANKVPEAGKSNKQRTKMSEWPNYLQEYYYQYHCLANFWILPMVVGRKSDDEYCKGYYDWFASDSGMQDYMDRFLKKVNDSFSSYKKRYATYFGKIDTFEDFLKLHFLNDVYVRDGRISSYSSLEPEEIVRTATDNIASRAIAISNSKYMEELWKYFDSQGLFD